MKIGKIMFGEKQIGSVSYVEWNKHDYCITGEMNIEELVVSDAKVFSQPLTLVLVNDQKYYTETTTLENVKFYPSSIPEKILDQDVRQFFLAQSSKVEKEMKTLDIENSYKNYYSSFSGADIIVSIEIEHDAYKTRHILSECQSIYWSVSENTIKGSMTLAVFDETPEGIRQLLEGNEVINLILDFADENGNRSTRKFFNIKATNYHGGVSMDDMILEEDIQWEAEKFTHMRKVK